MLSVSRQQLASGADGGEILLWKLIENPETSNTWKLSKNLRFHAKDVLDLQWSSDGTLLVSGSVDNTVIIWDIGKGSPQQVLNDHMHYVQGVAWDPLGQYIASISGDRTCRIYCNRPQNPKGKSQDRNNFSCQSVLVKAEVHKQEEETFAPKVAAAKQNLFHDETLPSFFRRLAWSPDGSFLLVPAGIHKFPSESVLTNTAFIVSRKDLSRPAVQLPGASKPIVAVRFCPVLFSFHPKTEQKLDKDSKATGIFKLPYRLLFAVATLNSLFVYDTQSAYPLAVLAGIHYAAITDIAWSWDAKYLAVSSQDGFCTLVAFDHEELGCPMPLNELPSYVAEFLPLTKDKVVGLHAKSPQDATKVQSKVEGDGNLAKRVDVLPDSKALAKENMVGLQAKSLKQATNLQNKGECQVEQSKSIDVVHDSKEIAIPERQDQEANPCVGLLAQASAIKDKSFLDSQHLDYTFSSRSSEKCMVSNTPKSTNSQSGPVKSRRITPIAITVNSSAPSQQLASNAPSAEIK